MGRSRKRKELTKELKKRLEEKIKNRIKKRIIAFILAYFGGTVVSFVVPLVMGLILVSVIGYNIMMMEPKTDKERDDSARLATPSECHCTLVGEVTNSGNTGSTTAQSTATGQKIADIAKSHVGIKYVHGAGHDTDPTNWLSGSDCSGQTYHILVEAGVYSGAPLTSQEFKGVGTEVSRFEDLLPGDLIINSHHVCIYIGDGKVYTSGGTGDTSHIGSADAYNKNNNNHWTALRRLVSDVTNNSTSVNVGGTGVIQSGSNALGRYIDNEWDVPLYDGYTFGSEVTYVDLDYTQFWQDASLQDGDKGYHLGMFAAGDKVNAVNGAPGWGRIANLGGTYGKDTKSGMSLIDGRIAVAAPYRVSTAMYDGTGVNDAFWNACINEDTSKLKPHGGKGDPPFYGEASDYGGKMNGGQSIYYDIVLDNGTVLPMISVDTKAIHQGQAGAGMGFRSDGGRTSGYCQSIMQDKDHSKVSRQEIFEFYGVGTSTFNAKTKPAFRGIINGHNIIKFRVYNITAEKDGKTVFTQGQNTAYGSSGGQAGTNSFSSNSSSNNSNNNGTATGNIKISSDGTRCVNCMCNGDCHCHDGSKTAKGASGVGGGSVGNTTLTETPGLPQGLYWNSAENRQYSAQEVADLFKTKFPNVSAQYLPNIGLASDSRTLDAEPDASEWKSRFNSEQGVITYGMSQSWGPLRWHLARVNGKHTDGYWSGDHDVFSGNSCGIHACAIAISTMLHRYITPPEIIMGIGLGDDLNPNPSTRYQDYSEHGGQSAFHHSAAHTVFDNFVYNGKQLFDVEITNSGTALSQAKLDDALSSGGVALFSQHNNTKNRIWTKAGHYLVIHTKGNDGLYYSSDGNGYHFDPADAGYIKKGFTIQQYLADGPNQCVYIKPGPGYADYMNDIKSKQSNSEESGPNSANNNTNSTEEKQKVIDLSAPVVVTNDVW